MYDSVSAEELPVKAATGGRKSQIILPNFETCSLLTAQNTDKS
jgi:hypothetical protein